MTIAHTDKTRRAFAVLTIAAALAGIAAPASAATRLGPVGPAHQLADEQAVAEDDDRPEETSPAPGSEAAAPTHPKAPAGHARQSAEDAPEQAGSTPDAPSRPEHELDDRPDGEAPDATSAPRSDDRPREEDESAIALIGTAVLDGLRGIADAMTAPEALEARYEGGATGDGPADQAECDRWAGLANEFHAGEMRIGLGITTGGKDPQGSIRDYQEAQEQVIEKAGSRGCFMTDSEGNGEQEE